MKKPALIVSWIVQVLAAVIMLQTLFFKVTGAPETLYIFETVGQEPVGRYGSAAMELVAGVLLFIPALSWAGALLGLAVISGAIFFHLTTLGIVIEGVNSRGDIIASDGGTLFIMALVVFFSCLTVLFLRRGQVPVIGPKLVKAAG